MYGWVGKILRVDLTTEEISTIATDKYVPEYLGGRGVAARIYWEEVPPEADPLGPENKLIYMTGPLIGTILAPSKACMAAKSPRTCTPQYSSGACGGYFPAELKRAGYDGIIVQGKSEKPVYIFIDDSRVEIRDARALWGLNTYAIQEYIWKAIGENVRTLTIGPAGENLVNCANVITDGGKCFGKSGFGAVMGSKNLKAISVRGTGRVSIAAQQEAALELVGHMENLIGRKKTETTYGTKDSELDILMREGKVRLGPQQCRNCTRQTGTGVRFLDGSLPDGEYACEATATSYRSATEYYGKPMKGTIVAWEPTKICDLMGMDIGEFSDGMWLWQAVKDGILTKENTGLDFDKFGSRETWQQILYATAYRQGAIGELFAKGGKEVLRYFGEKEGMQAAAERVKGLGCTLDGLPSWVTRSHESVKGKVIPSPRLIQGALGDTSNYGVKKICEFHEDGSTSPKEVAARNALAKELFGIDELDINTWHPPYLAYMINETILQDSLLLCTFWSVHAYYCKFEPDLKGDPHMAAKLWSAVTGAKVATDKELHYPKAERVSSLERAIHVREGRYGPKYDGLTESNYELQAERYTKEEFKEHLKDYFEERGWTRDQGIPTRAKLEELDLKDVADELEAVGKLP